MSESMLWRGKWAGLIQAADELAGMITTSREERDLLIRAERLIREEAESALERFREMARYESCDLPMSER